MESFSPEHLFKVSSNPPYFYTGRLGNGIQLLMGLQSPELVCLEFDKDGNYHRTIAENSPFRLSNSEQDLLILDEGELASLFSEWLNQMGGKSNSILVKQFFLSERWIGIKELPDNYQEVLDKPEDFTPERRQELQKDIEAWYESGSFVLYWDEDYYLSEDGELESN